MSAEEALAAAQRALSGDGTTVGPAEEFPGYYTLHRLQDGEVAGMAQISRKASLKMGWCLDCHRQYQASIDCWTCHI